MFFNIAFNLAYSVQPLCPLCLGGEQTPKRPSTTEPRRSIAATKIETGDSVKRLFGKTIATQLPGFSPAPISWPDNLST
jgi:hypothetical protein